MGERDQIYWATIKLIETIPLNERPEVGRWLAFWILDAAKDWDNAREPTTDPWRRWGHIEAVVKAWAKQERQRERQTEIIGKLKEAVGVSN